MFSFRYYYVLILILLFSNVEASGIISNNKYDSEFRTWSAIYMPGRDWRLLKAQCWQESRFNPNAVSPVKAAGLCQFMPATFKEVAKNTGFVGYSPFDPDLSIQFSAYYMNQQLKTFQSIKNLTERDKHGMAGYNTGAGNIIKSRRLCGNPDTWNETKTCLPKVTGKHHKETWGYVDAIYKFYNLLLGIE